MNTSEVLELTEAKELVNVGRFNEALPKLYRLAAVYPQDQEIQYLIKQCLIAQVPPPPQPQPIYQAPPPVYYYPQPIQIEQKPNNNSWIFILSLLSPFIIIVALFLPWFTLGFSSKSYNLDLSFNGIGMRSGSTELINSTNSTDWTKVTGLLIWGIPVGLVIIVVLCSIVCLVQPNKIATSTMLILSAIFLIYMGYDFYKLNDLVGLANSNLKASLLSDLTADYGAANIGAGFYVGCLGALLVFLFTLLADTLPYRK